MGLRPYLAGKINQIGQKPSWAVRNLPSPCSWESGQSPFQPHLPRAASSPPLLLSRCLRTASRREGFHSWRVFVGFGRKIPRIGWAGEYQLLLPLLHPGEGRRLSPAPFTNGRSTQAGEGLVAFERGKTLSHRNEVAPRGAVEQNQNEITKKLQFFLLSSCSLSSPSAANPCLGPGY